MATVRPSERGAAYRAFFQQLVDDLRERHRFTEVRRVHPRNFCNFATGTAGTHYAASFALNNEARVELCFSSKDQQANKALFDALSKDKTAIDLEFGEPLRWERDIKTWSRIAVYRPGSIEDRKALPDIHAWAIDRLLKFRKVFASRLRVLSR